MIICLVDEVLIGQDLLDIRQGKLESKASLQRKTWRFLLANEKVLEARTLGKESLR